MPARERDREVAQVELDEVSKHFGGVRALDRVSLSVARGSVHALVGENGAGKSTLGRIVAGVLTAEGGRMLLDGAPVSLRSPREALELGIATISQERSLVPQLSVAENVYLGAEPRRGGFVGRRALRRRYERLAASAGFRLPADVPAGRLRVAEQQKVEILRALSREAKMIVMDEPSAPLSRPETEQLHEIVRALVRSGKTIMLISHFLGEVLALADTVTVLRDGRVVWSGPTVEQTEASLVEAMLGRPLTAAFPSKQLPAHDAPVALSVRGLSAAGVSNVDFEVRAGEIVGLAGLVGSGRTELARAIFGADRAQSGEVVLGGAGALSGGPRERLRAGLALIPESRQEHGLVFGRSAIENVSLPKLRELSRAGFVRRRAERRETTAVLQRCDVRGASYTAPVRALSGGNQQKTLFARTLIRGPSVVIADEPTRGIDVGAKRAIYDFLASLAADGLAVLLISSEVEEILGLAHRVLVMRRGRVAGELRGEQITESAILAAAFSQPRAS